MTPRAPVTNLKSKKAQKAKPTLLERLNKPLRDFVIDFETYGAGVMEAVRLEDPIKYLELATKLAQLVAAIKPDTVRSGEDSYEQIARDTLKQIGCDDPDPAAIQAAIEAHEVFVAALQNIKAKAEGAIQ